MNYRLDEKIGTTVNIAIYNTHFDSICNFIGWRFWFDHFIWLVVSTGLPVSWVFKWLHWYLYRSACWLTGLLIGSHYIMNWLVSSLVFGELTDFVAIWLCYGLIDRMDEWLFGSWMDWMVDGLVCWLSYGSFGWLAG